MGTQTTQTPTPGPTAANTTPFVLANTSVVLASIIQMSEDELKHLYRRVREQLKIAHMLSTDNINVVSVRLPLGTCEDVRKLAVHRQETISDVVRDAIHAYCKEKGVSR